MQVQILLGSTRRRNPLVVYEVALLARCPNGFTGSNPVCAESFNRECSNTLCIAASYKTYLAFNLLFCGASFGEVGRTCKSNAEIYQGNEKKHLRY